MAEYIDKKHLDRKFQIDMMCIRGGTIFDTQRIIDSLPTADVIERSKIDKAIEEIKKLPDDYCDNAVSAAIFDALGILEENIGE